MAGLIVFCRLVTALLLTMSVSAYVDEGGAPPFQGKTSSGLQTSEGTAACGWGWPFGTQFKLPDGRVVTCWDRGPAVTDRHLDLWYANVGDAVEWGRRELQVEVLAGVRCQ